MQNKTSSQHSACGRRRTLGQRAADALTSWVGSWTFIITLSGILFLWIVANIALFVYQWDPYPFILLNLFLSFLAAYQAPIILMSQNRTADRDRAKATADFSVDKKAESEIRDIQNDLETIKAMLRRIENKK